MLCSVTVLGARNGTDIGAAAARVVDYLKGQRADKGHALRNAPEPPIPLDADGEMGAAAHYYGDSAEQAGRWLGSGFGDIVQAGAVDADEFSQLLLGINPSTGERLIAASGSAGRAQRNRGVAGQLPAGVTGTDTVGLKVAAEFLGLDRSYVRKLVADTAATRASGEEVKAVFLDGEKNGPGRSWEVTVAELQRFASAREAQSVVLGYDVTFSCPKSVSLLWAIADPAVREEILEAVEASVGAGIAYLEENGCTVKTGGELVAGDGLIAAGFLHATSRALDPQLHWHCVVVNATVGPNGAHRALDARGLFAHAKTAGYLAGAHLRRELATRLGVAWEPSVNGLADIAGIDRDTIEAFSKRTEEISEVADAAGLSTAAGRQSAALSTRSSKQAVDAGDLIDGWHDELIERGFTPERIGTLLAHAPPTRVTSDDRSRLTEELLSARGITELNAVFDRRDVIQRVAEWAGDRLSATEVVGVADEFLIHPEVVLLGTSQSGRHGAVIHRADGRTVRSGTGYAYTTTSMLGIEGEIRQRVQDGFEAGVARVPVHLIDAALSSQPALGVDQAMMVRNICQSGDRVQCVLGPAGSGKTFALEVATRAWEAAGYQVLGVAVAGVAAEVLSRSIGIETTTLAGILTRLETSGCSGLLNDRTVVIVDEASTVGTRDLARLLRWTTQTGAAVRLVGDPAQHSAVAAGGMFRHLVDEHPERVPVLAENRRQAGEQLGEVRLALSEYRDGQIAAALDRLKRDDRVVSAASADELLDALVADWYVDREQRSADPTRARSAMVAEHHFERRELNNRARAVLVSDGTLHGVVLMAGGQEFQAGDEVICRAQDKSLRPADGNRRSYVRNGSRGLVVTVHAGEHRAGLVVDFEGRGEVFVPRAFLEAEIRREVVGGLTHAYALTSHAAQGETYEAGRHLATDHSSREGVYVGLTRGRSDIRLYAVTRSELVPRIDDDPGLPRLEAETVEAREAVAHRLARLSGERLASEQDGLGDEARRLRDTLTPKALHAEASSPGADPNAVRAWEATRVRIAAEARVRPLPEAIERIGPRPAPGAGRLRWDTAAAAIAEHRLIFGSAQSPEAAAAWRATEAAIEAADKARSISQIRVPEGVPQMPEDFPSAGHSVAALPKASLER